MMGWDKSIWKVEQQLMKLLVKKHKYLEGRWVWQILNINIGMHFASKDESVVKKNIV